MKASWLLTLNDYLAYREGLGYASTALHRSPSSALIAICIRVGPIGVRFNPSFFLHMRANLTMEAVSVNHVLSVTRGFFRFLVRRGIFEKNPLLDIPPLKEEIIVPFIFSPEQTDQLLRAICKRMQRTKPCFLEELALYMVILLMARCGLRISEPLHLLKHHYRKEEGTIYIEKTKFSKDRLIPIPKAVMQEMDNYLSVRAHLCPQDQNPYLLAGKGLSPLSDQQVRFFLPPCRSRRSGSLNPEKSSAISSSIHPVPHCLRHSFAVNTLKAIKERGQSPQHALPVLATYLGHATYFNTSVYLKVADASSRNKLYDFSLWRKGRL